jgi:hypothetical protein
MSLVHAPTLAADKGADMLEGGVVQVAAAHYPALSGQSAGALSVMAWEHGQFRPVPFQVDEMSASGMIWFDDTELAPAGEPGVFDASDVLLVMRSDAGLRAPGDAVPKEGERLQELRLSSEDGAGGFLYVMRGVSQRSERQYVRHDYRSGVTHTDHYVLSVNPDNELDWHSLKLVGHESQGSIVDSLHIRLSANVLLPGARVTLDEDNLRPRDHAFRGGAIRTVVHSRTRIVIAGIPMMSLLMQTWRYPSHIEAHSFVQLPAVYKATLKKPSVEVALRGRVDQRALMSTGGDASIQAPVDGRMELIDHALVEKGLSTDNSRILFQSDEGFRLHTRLDVPASLEGIPLSLVYRDFEGVGPLVGYGLRGWPPERELRFTLKIFFESDADNRQALASGD